MSFNEILAAANQVNFMTIATMSENATPQAATVEFGLCGDVIIFDTFRNSRKFTNIQNDNHVALVMMPSEDISIDIEGRAELLEGEELINAQEAYFEKVPKARKWANLPNVAFFAVTIGWARCTDVSVSPWKVDIYHAKNRAEGGNVTNP